MGGPGTKEPGTKDAGASREKPWKDLDDPGRIERLRQVVNNQEALIVRMASYLTELVEHQHVDGKMVKRIGHPDSENYGGFHYRKRDREWF